VDADTKEYSVQRVVNVRTVPMWGFLVTEVNGTCANSSRRRVGNKGGESEDRQEPGERERERGELGTTKGGVPRHSRVTGGGGGWDYGVGIWFK